jgi:hypothetical protein
MMTLMREQQQMRGRPLENYRPRRRFWLPAMPIYIHVFNMHTSMNVIEKTEMALASFFLFLPECVRVYHSLLEPHG